MSTPVSRDLPTMLRLWREGVAAPSRAFVHFRASHAAGLVLCEVGVHFALAARRMVLGTGVGADEESALRLAIADAADPNRTRPDATT